ncbi:MAG: T9SS type A sorting domain-containing protein [Bacteroidales bacterium]|nr:T9SS type A sorting domain-containing protein [Bacteroidales bacterium]
MKRIIVFCLVAVWGITLLADTIEKTYLFEDYRLIQKGNYQLISFENTLLTGIAGEPTLPYQAVSLLLPPGHIIENIEIIGEEETVIPGTFLLYPQQHSQPLSKGNSGVFVKNNKIYASTNIYPAEALGPYNTEFMNGYSFALTTFTPVTYIPSTGNVSFYKRVTVRIETRKAEAALSALERLHSSESIKKSIQNFAQNNDVISSYPERHLRNNDYQILMITPILFENSFEELIELYLTRGFKTEVATVEFIESNISGQDIQEKIRNYIIQEYTNHGVEYILLGGDVEHFPYRGFYCHVQSSSVYEDDNIPSDLYYSGLDGTWNDNGNNLWGEIGEDDLLPDVAVARMSFSTQAELANMLNKIIEYQNNPVVGELNRPLLAGEHLWSNPETWGADYMDLLIGYHEDNGYTTDGIPEDDDYETLYEKDAPWNGSTLMGKINSGKSFVHHVGHASATYVAHLSNPDITDANFSGANGVDHNYTLFYTHGCTCGSFDYNDCIAEKMVGIQNFAAAFIGNSRYGWFNEGQTEGPSEHLHREFVDALYHDKLNRVGRAHMESRIATSPWVNAPGQWEEGALRWCFYDCNVLGDPTMAVWTDNPVSTEVDYVDAFPIGVPSMNVTVTSNGNALEGIRCALIKDGVLHGVGVTNSSGDALIELEILFTEVGEADLVISGYNCLPTYFPVTIIPNEGAYVVYEACEINDIAGNGNGLIDYGETISLSLTVTNVGTQTATNAEVYLSSADSNVTITDDFENYGNISGGQSLSLENAFAFEVANDVPDQHIIQFEIEVIAEDTWYSNFSLVANAPVLTIGNFTIDDTNGGNGDGKADPGETIDIFIETSNTGHSSCQDVTGLISSYNAYFTINNYLFEIEELEPGQTEYASFNATIDMLTPIGTTIDIMYDLTSGEYQALMAFHFTVGIIDEDFETADFLNFEWSFGGNAAWEICEDNPYEGLYCAVSGDIGDQQTTELFVTLEVLNDDSISFFRKVSSEANYDYLQFYIDNNKVGEWAGESDWLRVVFPVSTGEHTFKWVYSKDYSVANGEDCAWIDYIVFPPVYLPVAVDEVPENLKFSIYPNPFSQNLSIEYSLDQPGTVSISIFNATGQLATTIQKQHMQNEGQHQVIFNGSGLKSGVYFLSLATEKGTTIKKILITR